MDPHGAMSDILMNYGYADDVYMLYRSGILGGSDGARNFMPSTNIRRSEVAAVVCRMLGYDRQEFTLE
jgi:hypothetical protein